MALGRFVFPKRKAPLKKLFCLSCVHFGWKKILGSGTGIFIALSDSDVSGIGRRLVGCDGKAVEL